MWQRDYAKTAAIDKDTTLDLPPSIMMPLLSLFAGPKSLTAFVDVIMESSLAVLEGSRRIGGRKQLGNGNELC